ncbi:MAG: hypothetical protein Q8L22_22980, partial [Reyranella sp.]|nr:hypothetical protein [Reyranella sp.]
MKRRALLLGALLMPTAAHAQGQTTRKKPSKTSRKKQVAKPGAKPAAKAAPKPPPPPPREAKTQLVAFNASAFPYRGFIPNSTKPFLDARDGVRRGHTSLRGDVYWED